MVFHTLVSSDLHNTKLGKSLPAYFGALDLLLALISNYLIPLFGTTTFSFNSLMMCSFLRMLVDVRLQSKKLQQQDC